MYYVYEIINSLGTVEYVGTSSNPKQRFRHHTKQKPVSRTGQGKFYGRQDIFMHLVKTFLVKREALDFEIQLQHGYGFLTQGESSSLSHKKTWEIMGWATPRKRILSSEQDSEIKKLYSTGNYSLRSLGRLFGVSHQQIKQSLGRL